VECRTHLDFNGVETEAVVDTNVGANHLREDDSVAEVGLDEVGSATSSASLSLAEASKEVLVSVQVVTTLEAAASASVKELHELLTGGIDEGLNLLSAVEELTEGLLDFLLFRLHAR